MRIEQLMRILIWEVAKAMYVFIGRWLVPHSNFCLLFVFSNESFVVITLTALEQTVNHDYPVFVTISIFKKIENLISLTRLRSSALLRRQ